MWVMKWDGFPARSRSIDDFHLCPYHVTPSANISLFEGQARNLTGEQPDRGCLRNAQIFGVRQFGPARRQQFPFGTAHYFTKSTVDLQETAVDCRQTHAVRRLFEGGAEALLADEHLFFSPLPVEDLLLEPLVGRLQIPRPPPAGQRQVDQVAQKDTARNSEKDLGEYEQRVAFP